jgi:hypothetical protein
MTNDPRGKDQGPALTSERPKDDVNDDQPYSNRGTEDASLEPRGAVESAEGDRGEMSGHNLDQLAQVKTRPEDRR